MSGLNDGWDDDDDLDITPNDDDLGETSGEGWGDDDDLSLGEDDETPTSRNKTVITAFNPVPPQVPAEDGWGDDVDDLDLDDGFGDEPPNNRSVAETPPQSPAHVPPTTQNNFGEGVSLPANESTGGWEDDEELFGEEEEDTRASQKVALPLAPPSGPWDPNLQKIIQDLQSYVSSLDRILSSINAVLEFEYNTPQKAQELVDYYAGREKLAEYTRTKELPRMDYQVVTPYGYVETDKKQIAEHFLPNGSLVARSSNQSLLADLLQVITGPDLLVRPQFLAICVARSCKFTIHMGDDQQDMVNCACHLHLSLPTADGKRLEIADLKVSVVFAPHQPMVEYRVNTIDVLLKDYSRLASTAEFLSMMEGHYDELPGHEDVNLQNAPADIFRDAFLVNSQKIFTQSTVGMKGALKQMESVVNIRQKLNIVKGGVKTISNFLPGTDQMLAVEQEAMEFAAAREQQIKQESMFGPRPAHQPPPPRRARPQPPPRPTGGTDRPTSIIGGLVSSGWRTLAKSVAIPDEDPAIYGAPQQHTKQQPALYRKEESSPLKFYRPGEPQPPPSLSRPPHQDPIPAAPEAVFGGHQRVQEKTVAPFAPKPPNPRTDRRPPPPPPQQNQALRQDASVGGRTALEATPIQPQHVLPLESWEKSEEVLTQPDKNDPMPVETIGLDDKIENALVQETEATPSLAEADPGLHPSKPSEDTSFMPEKLKSDEQVSVAKTTFGFGESTEESFNEEGTGGSVQDGWDSDQIESEVFDSKNTSIDATPLETSNPEPLQDPTLHKTMNSGPCDSGVKRQRRPLIVDVDYNSDDDIIETRKRWVNPRPHRPYLPI